MGTTLWSDIEHRLYFCSLIIKEARRASTQAPQTAITESSFLNIAKKPGKGKENISAQGG
jgi:hypothetical protein